MRKQGNAGYTRRADDKVNRMRDGAMVRRSTYKGGKQIEADPKLDWAGNLAHMMGAAPTNHIDMRELKRHKVPWLVAAVASQPCRMGARCAFDSICKWASQFACNTP